jgi:hypothetical protein
LQARLPLGCASAGNSGSSTVTICGAAFERRSNGAQAEPPANLHVHGLRFDVAVALNVLEKARSARCSR